MERNNNRITGRMIDEVCQRELFNDSRYSYYYNNIMYIIDDYDFLGRYYDSDERNRYGYFSRFDG